MQSLKLLSPAKLNLFLAISGVLKEGYHQLISWMVPLKWGDTLSFTLREMGSDDVFEGDTQLFPKKSNLIIKALAAFRKKYSFSEGVCIVLDKEIPLGAGLGGGSSNAACVLLALNQLFDFPLSKEVLRELALKLGSDVPFFLDQQSAIARGRGEVLEFLPFNSLMASLPILIFKPEFSISTAWAYQKLRENPQHYIPLEEGESLLRNSLAQFPQRHFQSVNNFQELILKKHPELRYLFELLKKKFHFIAQITGSGSACFGFLSPEMPKMEIIDAVRSVLGEKAFCVETGILC